MLCQSNKILTRKFVVSVPWSSGAGWSISNLNMKPVDIHKAWKEADDTIAPGPSDAEVEYGEECLDKTWHSSRCQRMTVDQSMPCIKVQVEATRKYKTKLGNNVDRSPQVKEGD